MVRVATRGPEVRCRRRRPEIHHSGVAAVEPFPRADTSLRRFCMTTQAKTLFAEALGTALLVFFACGVAALTFGFGVTGASVSAGVVATSLAFGLVLLGLAYSLGPVSGCHVNPAVTMGFLVSKRFTMQEAVRYWVAQAVGGIVGALVLFLMFSMADGY